MRAVLDIAAGAKGSTDAQSFSSTAHVSLSTFRSLGATWGCYVRLHRCVGGAASRVFRLAVDESLDAKSSTPAAAGVNGIRIDHWPLSSDVGASNAAADGGSGPLAGEEVEVECVAPYAVREVQYLALSPATNDQHKLALSFTKSLLRSRVLTAGSSIVELRRDGVDYGRWQCQAYFPGRSKSLGQEDILDVGVVTDQTLVLLFPFTPTSPTAVHHSRVVQPVGSHARGFRELVAMTLRPSTPPTLRSQDTAVQASRSLLLHGPSGSGKTTLVRQVARDLGANLLELDGGLLSSPQLRLEDLFSAALRIQPCVLLLEDLELLFPQALDERKYKLVCRLVNCLESIHKATSVRVTIVGSVSVLGTLHPKVRQLFAEEVFLDVPDKQWTLELLTSLLPSPTVVRQDFLASMVVRYGQRPSNIVSIARQICVRLCQSTSDKNAGVLEAEVAAFARETSSSSGGADTLSSSVPDVSWTDIGGLERVKQSLLEMVVWPLEKPHVFRRMGISPPSGMVLYGPPGTGKTLLAKATAKASGCNFLNLSPSDLMKAEVGESEKAITRAFDTARALSPCMVFIDEFQSLFGSRATAGVTTSRMISQLLMEMDALKAVATDTENHSPVEKASAPSSNAINGISTGRIFVLAATNCLSAIDPAFLQPGRFENVVHVGLPNSSERAAILDIQRAKMPWHSDVDMNKLVEATEGANAATLIALCQAAAIRAMQRKPSNAPVDEQRVEMVDFDMALAKGNFDFGSPEIEQVTQSS